MAQLKKFMSILSELYKVGTHTRYIENWKGSSSQNPNLPFSWWAGMGSTV